MANLSEDIQCAGSDARTPMLDRTNFASWQQRIRLYCLGKGNRVNILKSIDEGPFQMGTFWETLAEDKERYNADIRATNILLQGLPKDIYSLINHYTDAKDIWDNVKMLLEGSELTKEDRESQLYDDFEHFRQHKGETIHDYYYNSQSSTNTSSTYVPPHFADNTQLVLGLSPSDNLIENLTNTLALLTQSYKTYLRQTNNQLRTSSNPRNQATVQDGRVVVQNVQGHISRNYTQPKRPQNSEYFKDKMLLMQAQENGVALDEEQLLFIAADDCDAFDSDVDEAHMAQTMFMANLSSTDPVYDEAGPSYDSDILSEVHDHDHYQDAVCKHHEEHEMHDDVQPNYVVDLHANYTSDSNMIPYDQYVKYNALLVVQSNVSSVPNDVYMMIFNEMHEPHAQSISDTSRNTVVDNSLTVKLATYKEQVELYERQARIELTEREQKIDEQLRIVITDRNIKEENLKKELHSIKMQLASTINHNKSMVEEVTSLKKDFKQKENKYLKEFLDMKALKVKNKVAIGYKNPLCLTRTKQVQPAQYNGYEIIKNNHISALVHNIEDTLEIAEIIRRKMNDKMKDPESHQDERRSFQKANCLKTNQSIDPRVLPTKIQVKINIFALIQLFLEFEKTCKKRITPTGLTEGERGFEQTKECYLTEVIPFFKTLKEHFEGIQKALTKEIKEMKDIFEELEAEVDQNVVNRKHDEIERKNLLIANDNLIADCLSKEVFYIATNSELTVSRFTDMHEAHTIVQTRCLELEAELSKLRDKVQKDDHTELVKRFSNLEVNHLNLQLKYQNLKESFGNDPSPPARDTPDFDSVFVIEKMKASIQGKDNAIKKLRTQISQLKETRSEADRTLDFRTLDFQITQLTEKVSVLQEKNELVLCK
ncbi:hypothetical protein Tco_0805293 [Tanacetum coccineum]